MDNISNHLIIHAQKTPAVAWEYFLSEYAKKYTISLIAPIVAAMRPTKRRRRS